MQIKAVIIDDEPLARKGLEEYIGDIDFLELQASFDNPLQAASLLSAGQTDLLFLDIEMPKITGLEFFRTLKDPPPVIFTTAYPQYALEGFEVNALDYLVKPVSFDRFLKAALKAKEFYDVRHRNQDAGEAGRGDYFFIKTDGQLVRVDYDDILFVEAVQNYVTVHTANKKMLTYLTFRAVEEYLPQERFIKVHKSYIVAAAKIDAIEGNDIRIGDRHIPVSRNQKEDVMEKLLKNRYLRR